MVEEEKNEIRKRSKKGTDKGIVKVYRERGGRLGGEIKKKKVIEEKKCEDRDIEEEEKEELTKINKRKG